MSEKKYDSLTEALMSLYAPPLGDIEAEQDMLNERSSGPPIIDDSQNPEISNQQVYTPKFNTVYNTDNMDTSQKSTFEPRENQKINVETVKPGLTSLENNLKENVIPVNLVDEPKENVTDKSEQSKETVEEEVDTVPTISQMYPRGTNLIQLYESKNKTGEPYLKAYKDPSTGIMTIGLGNIKIDGRNVKEGDIITKQKAIQMFNESLKESISELQDLKKYLPKGVKFSKGFESALISILHNSSPNKIKYIKGKETRGFKALKRGDLKAFSKELFDPKVGIVSAGGKIRKGLVDRRQKELQYLDPLERYDIEQKQSGGMIESDPYKRQPRFI